MHETPNRVADRLGVRWTDQPEPFQCSTSTPVDADPTAVQASLELHDTAVNVLYAGPGSR